MNNDNRVSRCLDRAFEEHERIVAEPPRGYWVDREGTILRQPTVGKFLTARSHQSSAHNSHHIIKYVEDGLGWKLDKPYCNSANLKRGGFSWCGAFQAYCDIWLKREIRKKVMPSTYRLYEFCVGTEREIPLDQIEAGDIVVVGRKGGKRWGAHITRAVNVTEEYVETIEGNAHGELGDGSWGEGVITTKRPFKGYESEGESRIMFAYRFLDEDYEG